MVNLQNLTYIHPNGDVLFDNLNLHINKHEKIALVGHNGVGKSTLLKIITGAINLVTGLVSLDSTPYYVPQLSEHQPGLSVADILGIRPKIQALQAILAGHATAENFALLNDDWTIEDRCAQSLEAWGLAGLNWDTSFAELSGGQQTKVWLAGITLHQADLVLLDEPSNHLDLETRDLLYQWLANTKCTVLIVSHDQNLLRLLPEVYELSNTGILRFGGSYDFYEAQKELTRQALADDINAKHGELRKAKAKERETLERQQKLDARGRRKQEQAGAARIMINTMRNNAENSTAKSKSTHAAKKESLMIELQQLRAATTSLDQINFTFGDLKMPRGKVFFKAEGVNVDFVGKLLWDEGLDLELRSGERIVLKGRNGSGKTTLAKLILGQQQESVGIVYRSSMDTVYLDQHYQSLNHSLTVYEQLQQFNAGAFEDHEVKTRLAQFLFDRDSWDQKCLDLSGGERLRLILCSLTLKKQAPAMLVLDEPTNNLDLQNVKMLIAALNAYEGTLLIISHDQAFLDSIRLSKEIILDGVDF